MQLKSTKLNLVLLPHFAVCHTQGSGSSYLRKTD